MSLFSATETKDWVWFEDVLAYDNARLPQALIQTGLTTHTPPYVEVGLRSLRWLMSLQTTSSGYFRPVGTKSFGRLRQKPEAFDQQPVEASATISACLAAWRADDGAEWPTEAMRAFGWFLGENDLQTALIDPDTGSCSDGLHPDRPNENKGAESVLSYLLGLVEIRQFKRADCDGPNETCIQIDRQRRQSRDPTSNRSQGASLSQSQFLNRQSLYLRPDPARVVVRPFKPATEPRDLNPTDKIRANHIVDRVLRLDAEAAAQQLSDVLENFEGRHRNLLDIFETRAAEMEDAFEPHAELNKTQRRLIGAYFLHEYSFEASALFNPSIVRHPDQTGAPENGCRFILSLRAVGEGHISSLTFRSGTIAADGSVAVDPTARLASVPKVRSRTSRPNGDDVEVVFRPDEELSERVIFPITDAQSNGIEDARFVEFNDDARKTFYATYTAYSGRAIRSELLETTDFRSFRMTPLGGSAARNKGMALFPRKIDGRYAMIGRQDNENLYLIYSDDLYTWDGGQSILQPEYPWEFVQIGNCGSPIELDDCWLLLTHGVGPVRKYSIGAVLLDKKDPSKVLARSREPLVRPEPTEREGYVPNVVYTCGAMRHARSDHLALRDI